MEKFNIPAQIEPPESGKIERALQIGQSPSTGLAAFIVLYKGLGMQKDFAIICMQELARRRNLGEDFDYEGFIDTEIAKLPKPQSVDIRGINGMFRTNMKTVISDFQKKK